MVRPEVVRLEAARHLVRPEVVRLEAVRHPVRPEVVRLEAVRHPVRPGLELPEVLQRLEVDRRERPEVDHREVPPEVARLVRQAVDRRGWRRERRRHPGSLLRRKGSDPPGYRRVPLAGLVVRLLAGPSPEVVRSHLHQAVRLAHPAVGHRERLGDYLGRRAVPTRAAVRLVEAVRPWAVDLVGAAAPGAATAPVDQRVRAARRRVPEHWDRRVPGRSPLEVAPARQVVPRRGPRVVRLLRQAVPRRAVAHRRTRRTYWWAGSRCRSADTRSCFSSGRANRAARGARQHTRSTPNG